MRIAHACASGLALAGAVIAIPAEAADGFRVRYPLSGTLGGEVVASAERAGWFGSVVLTSIDLPHVNDANGNPRQEAVAGSFATPAPIAGAVRTAGYAGTVNFDASMKQTQTNLIVGYLTEPSYGGGRLSVVFNLPYSPRYDRHTTITGTTPTLTTLQPALPAPVAAGAQAQVQAAFGQAYQASLGAASTSGTGVIDGLGDAEVSGAWVYQDARLKFIGGATLAMPTGRYDAASTVNVGFGNYYTLRPGVAVAYKATDAITLAARTAIGLNTGNRDNHIRTGNYAALDLAVPVRTPIGIVGPHFLRVQQYQDDTGGTFGPNRFRVSGAGAFFTSLIPQWGLGVNLSWMRTIDARNALEGSFVQARVTKLF